MTDIKQSLRDFVATSNSKKYSSEDEIFSKFPEFSGYDRQLLRDFVATSNSRKYATEDEIFAKFPEFFEGEKKKDQSSTGSNQTQPGSGSNNSQFDPEEYLRRAKAAGWNTAEEYTKAGHRYKENVSDEELEYIQPTNKKVIYRGDREDIENQLAAKTKKEVSQSYSSESTAPVALKKKYENVEKNEVAADTIIKTFQAENKSNQYASEDIDKNYKEYADTAVNDYLDYLEFTDRGGSLYQKTKEKVDYYKSLGDKLYNDENYADDLRRYQDLQKDAILNVNKQEIKSVNKLKDKYDWDAFNKKTSEVELKLSNIEKQIKNISSDGSPLTPLQQKKYDDLMSQYSQIQNDYIEFSSELGITQDVIDEMSNSAKRLSATEKVVNNIENEDNVNSKRIRDYKSQLLANKKAQEEFYGDPDQGWLEQTGKGILNAGEQLGSSFTKSVISVVSDLPQLATDAIGVGGYGVTDRWAEAGDNINSYVDLVAPQLDDKSFPGFVKASGVIGNGLGSMLTFATAGGGATKWAKGVLKTSTAKGLQTASRAGAFTAASSLSAGQLYDQLLEEGFSPEEASRYAIAGGVVMGAAEMIVPEDELLSNTVRRTFIGAIRNKSTIKEASEEALKFVYNRGLDITKNSLKEGGEEAIGQFAQDVSLQATSSISGKQVDGLWEIQPYVNNALAGGGVGGVVELLKFGTRNSRYANKFKESMLSELAENYDDISNKMSQIKPEDFEKIGEKFAKLKNVNNALKDIPRFENLSHAEKSHILALAYNKQVILDGIKQSGLDKSNFQNELDSIETEIQSTLTKSKENAVQESSTEEVLPREQGATPETGGQPQGVGQSVQGEVVAQEGQEVSQEGLTPEQQVSQDAGDVIAEVNPPSTLAASVYPVIGEIETAIENNQPVNEEQLTDAENKLYSLLDEIDSRQDLTPDQKQRMASVIENRITKLQNYDNRTRTETSTTTQAVAAGRVEKTQKPNERATIPVRTVAEEGIDVTYDGRPGRIELRDGQYVFVPKKLGAVQARPIVIGEAAQVNANSAFAGVENPTKGQNNSVANITLPNGSTLAILNDDLSIDIGLEIAKKEIGAAPQSLFDVVFDEVVSEQKKEVPVQKQEEAQVETTEEVEQPTQEAQQPVQEAKPEQAASYTGVTPADRSLKQKYKDDSRKRRVLDQAQRIANAIGSDVPVFIHETTDDYNSALSERGLEMSRDSSNGKFVYSEDGSVKEIHINLSEANERTIAHEAAHAVLFKAFGDNQALFLDFKDRLANILQDSTVKELEAFANNAAYVSQGVSAEEFLAELAGKMTAEGNRIPKTTLQKIAKLINEFVGKITKGKVKVFEDTANTADVIDFFNSMADAFAKGKFISVNELGLKGVIQSSNAVKSKSSITGDIKRFPVNKNTKVEENVPLEQFDGKLTNLFESDRMVGGFIGDTEGNILFKFFGGVYYPIITGKWWASRNKTKAKSIAENGNKNRDADGYIYAAPMIGSDKQHMSNVDMLNATVELMKFDANKKSSKVKKADVISYINKAFSNKSVENKKNVVKSVLKKSNTINELFNELEFVLFQEGDNILDRNGNPILDNNKKPISNFTFEQRLDIVNSILGDPKVKDPRFPSAGSVSDAAKRFEEPVTGKAKKIGDLVVIMRTKGTLKYKTSDVNDDFYHKSYPEEIYPVNEDGSPAEIEMYVLDGAYSLDKVLPSLTQSSGKEFTWNEYIEKHKSENLAIAQYNRTAKLSSAAGNLKTKSQINEITLKDGSVITPTEIEGQTIFYHASSKKREGRLKPNMAPQWGKAVYFATDKYSATDEFGKDNTTEVNLNLKNPVYTNSKEFKNLEGKATELYNKDMLPKILEDETYYVNGERVFSDEDIQLEYEKNGFIDKYSASDIEDGKYFGQAAKELGYDAIIDVSNSQYGTEIAVIDESTIIYPEDIKSKSQEGTPKMREFFHGGRMDSEGDIFLTPNKKIAKEYASNNRGELMSFSLDENKIIQEDEVRDIIDELGIEADTDYLLHELLDERFDTALPKSDIDKVKEEVQKRGYDAISYTDEDITQESKGGVESIMVLNKESLNETPIKEAAIPKAKSQESSMVSEMNQAMNKTGLAKENAVKRFIEKYGQNGLVAKEIIDNFDKIQEQLGITKICNI